MIDDVFHASSLAWRHGHLVPLLNPTIPHAAWNRDAVDALDEIPDAVLRDLGLTRSETPFAAVALSHGRYDAPRHQGNGNLAHTLPLVFFREVFAVLKAIAGDLTAGRPRLAQRVQAGSVRTNSGRRP